METTRMTHHFRIKKMMTLLVIGFCWTHKTGEWKHSAIKPLRIKKHGRLEKSLFRYGLDHLAEKLFDGVIDSLETSRLLLLLFCPFNWLVFENEGQKVANEYGIYGG